MKAKSKAITFRLLLLCAWTVLVSSCEKDTIGFGTGRKVAVNLAVNGGDYAAEAPRSSDARELKPETAIVPLGNGFHLYATLEASPNELRAALNTNQRLCVAAYTGAGTTPYSAAKYIWSGGALTADPAGSELLVEEGVPYYFVAYSYNSTTAYPSANPATAVSLTNVNPSTDLLWGTTATPTQTITATNQKVSLNMAHKFAQITVVVNINNMGAAARITNIGTVQVSGGKLANLALQAGTLTAGSDVAQNVSLSVPGGGASTVTGTTRLVTPVASPAEVIISSVTLDMDGAGPEAPQLHAGPFSVKFTKALLAGTSYTLTVDLKEVIFAGSNIYWHSTGGNDGYLTFAPTGDTSKEGYQGVLFKWGSLVGISPVPTSTGPSTFISGFIPASTPIYVPNVPLHASWTAGLVTDRDLGGPETANTYGEIPWVEVPGFDDPTTNYLYDISDATSYNAYKGDICRYLTDYGYAPAGSWRMPVNDEFVISPGNRMWSTVSPVFEMWTRLGDASWPTISSSSTAPGDEYGTRDYADGTCGVMYQGIFFPPTAVRSGTGSSPGLLGNVGQSMVYWTGSPSSTFPYTFLAAAAVIAFRAASDPPFGYGVRCVKNN